MTKAKQKKMGRPQKTQGFPRLTLRLPQDLHDKLASYAEESLSSINTEIIRRLRHSFKLKGLN